jgi:hypothetical protein
MNLNEKDMNYKIVDFFELYNFIYFLFIFIWAHMFFKSRLALLFLILLGLSIIAAGYKCTRKVVSFLSCWMLNGGHRWGGKSPVTLSRQVRESTSDFLMVRTRHVLCAELTGQDFLGEWTKLNPRAKTMYKYGRLITSKLGETDISFGNQSK